MDKNFVMRNIEIIQKALDDIKKEFADDQVDPYKRRERVLKKIFDNGSVDKDKLYEILESEDANPQWVGMQVKAGYLLKAATPDGARYSVTEKAVKEYKLDDTFASE